MASAHIVALGARTPIGLSALHSAAAARASVNRIREHTYLKDRTGQPVMGAWDGLLSPQLRAVERMITMVSAAAREACSALAERPPVRLAMPVYLALPELRPGFDEADSARLSAAVRALDVPLDRTKVHAFCDGHAGGLLAFQRAMQSIQAGLAEACLVLGVDSYANNATLAWLDTNRQLACDYNRSGFVPGEGAGACIVANHDFLKNTRMSSLAKVRAVRSTRETNLIKTEAVCLAEGLTSAVRYVLEALEPHEAVSDVLCDMNGERYRGEEWGFVCLRLGQRFIDPTGYRCAADCWGDVGAASGPLHAILACHAAKRGYARGKLPMLWASSEAGLRAAMVLETS
jgi:3-oxoacyl-[acyl-carrier-protein] synthase-1